MKSDNTEVIRELVLRLLHPALPVDVPSKGLPEPSFADAGLPFKGGELYYIKGIKEMQVLFLTWQLPTLRNEYQKKADVSLTHVF